MNCSFGLDEVDVFAWLERLGEKFEKGRRHGVELNGHPQLVVDYPTLPDLLDILQEVDAIIAMSQEARRRRFRSEPSSPTARRLRAHRSNA